MTTRICRALPAVAVLLVALAGPALAQLTTFSPNTPALADEVNANFSYVDGRITSHEGNTTLHSDTLKALGCATGEVAKSDGGNWLCGTDNDTTYSAGAGLVLTATQFSLNSSGCASGYVLKSNGGGSWTCQADNNTTYTASGGATISGTNITLVYGGTGAATNPARSDHNHNGTYAPIAVNVIQVNPGTSINTAYAATAGASATNQFVLKLAPGTYMDSTLQLLPYRHIQGSGQGVSIMKVSGTEALKGANDSTLSDLTVDATGSTYGIINKTQSGGLGVTNLKNVTVIGSITAIAVFDALSMTLENVTVDVSATWTNATGIQFSSTGNLVLRNVHVTVSGATTQGQALSAAGTATVVNSSFTATGPGSSYGIVSGGTMNVHNSVASGGTAGVWHNSGNINLFGVQLIGGHTAGAGTGTLVCAYTIDGAYNELVAPGC